MKHALILHAWQNGPDDHWYPWLKRVLEHKGYSVHLPDIPTMKTQSPDLVRQLEFITKEFPIHKDSIVIGHSLSCLLSLRLAEKFQFAKMFLIAGWDFDDLTHEHQSFWQNKIDHAAIRKNVRDIYCFTSDNDPYITAFTAEEMSKRLGGKFKLIKGAGHFTKEFGIKQIPEVLQYLA